MLKPAKHLDLSNSVLNISGKMLRLIRRKRVVSYSELFDSIAEKIHGDIRELFVPSISFLFLLGRVDYFPQSDTFEYIEPPSDKGGS